MVVLPTSFVIPHSCMSFEQLLFYVLLLVYLLCL